MTDDVEIYQFHWYLKGISPLIWRRVLVRSDSTLADLHYIIQIVMGWSNYYLHQFIVYGKRYAVFRSGGTDAHDAHATRLCDLGLRLNGRFLYEYSFFEWWRHELRLEKKLAFNAWKAHPVCIGAGRASPPEDCEGAEGFMQRQDYFSEAHMLFRVLAMHEQFQTGERLDEDDMDVYREELRQLKYWLNAKHFDRKAVNQRLKWYTLGDKQWTEGLEAL
jgi:hypothetical protein